MPVIDRRLRLLRCWPAALLPTLTPRPPLACPPAYTTTTVEGLKDLSGLVYGWRLEGDVSWESGCRVQPGACLGCLLVGCVSASPPALQPALAPLHCNPVSSCFPCWAAALAAPSAPAFAQQPAACLHPAPPAPPTDLLLMDPWCPSLRYFPAAAAESSPVLLPTVTLPDGTQVAVASSLQGLAAQQAELQAEQQAAAAAAAPQAGRGAEQFVPGPDYALEELRLMELDVRTFAQGGCAVGPGWRLGWVWADAAQLLCRAGAALGAAPPTNRRARRNPCHACRRGRAAPRHVSGGGRAGGAHPGGGRQRRGPHPLLRHCQRWVGGWVGFGGGSMPWCSRVLGIKAEPACPPRPAFHAAAAPPPPHRASHPAGIGLMARAAVHHMAADPLLGTDPASSLVAAAEFRRMVSALHAAKIEVYLQVSTGWRWRWDAVCFAERQNPNPKLCRAGGALAALRRHAPVPAPACSKGHTEPSLPHGPPLPPSRLPADRPHIHRRGLGPAAVGAEPARPGLRSVLPQERGEGGRASHVWGGMACGLVAAPQAACALPAPLTPQAIAACPLCRTTLTAPPAPTPHGTAGAQLRQARGARVHSRHATRLGARGRGRLLLHQRRKHGAG